MGSHMGSIWDPYGLKLGGGWDHSLVEVVVRNCNFEAHGVVFVVRMLRAFLTVMSL